MKEEERIEFIKEAHHEAHMCNALVEVHDWIDWFDKKLKEKESDNLTKKEVYAAIEKHFVCGFVGPGVHSINCRKCKLKKELGLE